MQALKVLVVVMGLLIVGGVVVLGVTITRRLSTSPAGLGSVLLDEPAGTRIVAASGAGDHILVQLSGGGPDRVAVVGARDGRVVGRIGLAR